MSRAFVLSQVTDADWPHVWLLTIPQANALQSTKSNFIKGENTYGETHGERGLGRYAQIRQRHGQIRKRSFHRSVLFCIEI